MPQNHLKILVPLRRTLRDEARRAFEQDTAKGAEHRLLVEVVDALEAALAPEGQAREALVPLTDGRTTCVLEVVIAQRQDASGATGYLAKVNHGHESIGFAEGDTRYQAAIEALSSTHLADDSRSDDGAAEDMAALRDELRELEGEGEFRDIPHGYVDGLTDQQVRERITEHRAWAPEDL